MKKEFELRKLIQKNKKAELVLETIIFIVLNAVFFVSVLYFVYSSGNKNFIYEGMYAKKIALVISSSKPGTTISMDISELIDRSNDNGFNSASVVHIDNDKNRVSVGVTKAGDYSFSFFSNNTIGWIIDKENKRLNLTIR